MVMCPVTLHLGGSKVNLRSVSGEALSQNGLMHSQLSQREMEMGGQVCVSTGACPLGKPVCSYTEGMSQHI